MVETWDFDQNEFVQVLLSRNPRPSADNIFIEKAILKQNDILIYFYMYTDDIDFSQVDIYLFIVFKCKFHVHCI